MLFYHRDDVKLAKHVDYQYYEILSCKSAGDNTSPGMYYFENGPDLLIITIFLLPQPREGSPLVHL